MGLSNEAAALDPGHGELDLGIGAQSDLGVFGRLRLLHRFSPALYGGLEGRGVYDLAGPRRGKMSGQVLGVLGGRW